MNEDITVGQYLAHRLLELGGPHIFGLPGDFNLGLLDEMLSVPGTIWVGNTNELNGAYAADAYARTIQAVGALVTTYGVGELSALNGIAGSYAEDVPVVQITGMPLSAARTRGDLLHHTLADGDFDHFFRAYAEVTAAGAILRPENAGNEIDRILRVALDRSKPVYLGIPIDVATTLIPAAPLTRRLRPSPSDPATSDDFRAALTDAFAGHRGVTILAGMRIHRRGAESLLEKIAQHPGVRVATQAGAKAILPEGHPASVGTYMGSMTVAASTRLAVDEAALLVLAGTVLSDVLTGVFSQKFDTKSVIDLGLRNARIGATTFYDVRLDDSLSILEEVIATASFDAVESTAVNRPTTPTYEYADDEALTQDSLWAIVQSWLPADAIVIADSGTALMGALALDLPPGTELLAQPIWASIGYTLPATLGTSLGAPGQRSVLFIGDGAAQLTVQELATVLHRGLQPIIVVINNAGYTIERKIQSPCAVYQDITSWDWLALPAAFAPGVPVFTASASTVGELSTALAVATHTPDRLVLLEAKLDPLSAPPLLTQLGRATADANRPGSGRLPAGISAELPKPLWLS
jgi:TPP-dependent 2-oxoacid decarboxylase